MFYITELFEWHLKTVIKAEQHEGKPLLITKIACCPNGEIAATESTATYKRITILTPDHDAEDVQTYRRRVFRETDDEIRTKDLLVSKEGHVIQVQTDRVAIFDRNLKQIQEFSVQSAGNDPNEVYLLSGTIDRKDNLLLYDRQRVIIHKLPSGKLVNTLRLKLTIGSDSSVFMTRNHENHILFHHFYSSRLVYSQVVAVDQEGNEVFSFSPRIDENITNKWVWAEGIACDAYGNIYVGMRVLGEGATGHIHKYDPTGAFIGCLIKGLNKLSGLGITPNGSLVITDLDSIRIYDQV